MNARRAAAIMILCAPAAAQTLPLSLKRAIEIALAPEGNTRVELAEESIRQAESRKAQARAALLPNIEASIGYRDVTQNLRALGIDLAIPIPGFRLPSVVGPFNVFDARGSLTQNVFDFSSIRRYQSAGATVDTTKKEKDNTREVVTSQVARAYLDAVRAEAHLDAARANVDLAEALRNLALSQKTAGTGTGIEVTRADVQLSNERQRLIEAQNQRERAHLQLLRALGLRLDTRLELTDKLRYEATQPMALDEALKSALATRADWLAQQKREEAARLNYSSVKLERLPSLAAFADYGSIGSGLDNALPTRTYGVALRVPVFDGGRRDARRGEAASQVRQEKIRAHDLHEQLELEIRLAFDSLRSAEAQVSTADEGFKLAENELAQAERRYRAGVANNVEVTDAQTRLVRARENRILALFNHNMARLDLGAAIGSVERFVP